MYRIEPVGGTPYNVEADRAEHDKQTGATSFFKGDELVARVLNASFSKLPDQSAS